MKRSPKRKYLDHLKILSTILKGMYRDQSGEFVSGYWGLKGLDVLHYFSPLL